MNRRELLKGIALGATAVVLPAVVVAKPKESVWDQDSWRMARDRAFRKAYACV